MQICVRDHVEVHPQKKKEILYFGGVTPIMAYTGRLRPKGIYVSQASDVRKGRDFISCSI